MSGGIRLVGLSKRFGDARAVDHLDLEVHPGEFFAILGPSGCGKTTTLRLVAGLEAPTGGEILLDGRPLSGVPAHRRNVNTVFQNYALFPHLDVFDNIAFGLRRQRVRGARLRQRVTEALELVRLDGLAHRRPAELSGGQQQRVALARALVLRPAVLLLDEPLGSLDAKLRKQLQTELKTVQEQVGSTFLLVTHDQDEALRMSDRLAVMRAGRIEQVGTPRTLYDEPATVFVADFLGAANLLTVEVDAAAGDRLRIGELSLRANSGPHPAPGSATIVVRPEHVLLEPYHAVPGENRLPAMVERVTYGGAVTHVAVRTPNGARLEVSVPNTGDGVDYPPGTPVCAYLPPHAIRILAQPEPNGSRPAP
jgi:spermidine/putrescine transport system ATP-binding protein